MWILWTLLCFVLLLMVLAACEGMFERNELLMDQDQREYERELVTLRRVKAAEVAKDRGAVTMNHTTVLARAGGPYEYACTCGFGQPNGQAYEDVQRHHAMEHGL